MSNNYGRVHNLIVCGDGLLVSIAAGCSVARPYILLYRLQVNNNYSIKGHVCPGAGLASEWEAGRLVMWVVTSLGVCENIPGEK